VFYIRVVEVLIEHWFNRRYRIRRRDIYLRHDSFGWYVRARHGGSDGTEVTHVFADEPGARQMVARLKSAAPPEESDWALMPPPRRS
jgi:hypothetical protein